MGSVAIGLWTSGTGGRGAVAVAAEDGRCEVRSCGVGRRASEELLPALAELLSRLGATVGDVSSVAAASGPGSFTGIRVGLAAAEGLRRALGVPVMGVPSLRLLAQLGGEGAARVLAVVPAGRAEVFAAEYRPTPAGWDETTPPGLWPEAALAGLAPGARVVAEEGWTPPAGLAVARWFGAEACAEAAARVAADHGGRRSGAHVAPEAVYVRQSWAEEVAGGGA